MSTESTNWFPEIMYEEDSKIPFIPVPVDELMPPILFIFESRVTDRTEPGPEGEELPVMELDLHQFADMQCLKEKLTLEHFNIVRNALGLEPLETAAIKGMQVTERVRNSLINIEK